MAGVDLLLKLASLDPEDFSAGTRMPDRRKIVSIVKSAQVVLLPHFYSFRGLGQKECFLLLTETLKEEMRVCYRLAGKEGTDVEAVAEAFMERLVPIKELLMSDVQAIYDGDPAAKSKAEVILCYPGFYAISIYRIAHELYRLQVPYIPRIMTEYAHEKTGVDINPGAQIGPYFCIDHGTGIVIGETAVLGHHVKLYQGVTIGARSFEMDENGLPVKGGKRHPDIGDNVVIYANATILGGDTRIGSGCVIGGNVWLTKSVPDGQKIYYQCGLNMEGLWSRKK